MTRRPARSPRMRQVLHHGASRPPHETDPRAADFAATLDARSPSRDDKCSFPDPKTSNPEDQTLARQVLLPGLKDSDLVRQVIYPKTEPVPLPRSSTDT